MNLPLYILVVLLYPAANFPPSLAVNPEICRLTGADMVVTWYCTCDSSRQDDDDDEKLIAFRQVMGGSGEE